MSTGPTTLHAFLLTDIEGSTHRWQADSELMSATLATHDECLRREIEQAGGATFKHTGDGLLASFGDAGAAVEAALDGQRALRDADWGQSEPLKVRMAVHVGPAEERGGDYFGTTLNRGARLLEAAHGEQILCSGVVAELAGDALPVEADLLDLGAHRLRDLNRAERVFQLVAGDLRREFPPPRTLSETRHNLPIVPTELVGRERELETLAELIVSSPLITLTGVGGAGKTRLALELAARHADSFVDGVFLVDFTTAATDEAVIAVCTLALGIGGAAGSAMSSDREQLLTALRAQELLLVLDNCEHVVDGAAGLVAEVIASCEGVRIVATSREALAVEGEQIWPVGPLDIDQTAEGAFGPAVELFISRARAVQPDFTLTGAEAEAVRGICKRLDGLPLAIELAAARTSHLTVPQIAERLDDRFRLLRGGRRRADRHATLHTAIEWSHDLLDEPERLLFRRIGVFVGAFTLEAVEGVCVDDERLDALDLLAALVDRSLVVADPPRYRMLETIRIFAEEKLVAAGEAESFRERHAEWFSQLVAPNVGRMAGPESWAQLDPLYGNFRAAIEWALESELPELASRLVAGTMGMGSTAGEFSERASWIWRLIEAPADLEHEIRATLWMELCMVMLLLGNPSTGEIPGVGDLLVRATEAETLPDGFPLACLWAERAMLAGVFDFEEPGAEKRTDVSIGKALEAMERAQLSGAEAALTRAWFMFALFGLRRFDEAAAAARQTVEGFGAPTEVPTDSSPATQWKLGALSCWAVAELLSGNPDAAYEPVRPIAEAVRAREPLPSDAALAYYGSALAAPLAARGEVAEARAIMRRSVDAVRRTGIPLTASGCLIGYAAIAAYEGDWERTALLLAASRSVVQQEGAPNFNFRSPQHGFLYLHYRDFAREQLGPDPARALRDQGLALSYEEALALADPEAFAG